MKQVNIYVTKLFLLVSFSEWSKQLIVFCAVRAKKDNKNIQQVTWTIFITTALYQL